MQRPSAQARWQGVRKFEPAFETWASYLGARRGDRPDSNLVFNGDFENDPT